MISKPVDRPFYIVVSKKETLKWGKELESDWQLLLLGAWGQGRLLSRDRNCEKELGIGELGQSTVAEGSACAKALGWGKFNDLTFLFKIQNNFHGCITFL